MTHNYIIQRVPGRKQPATFWLCEPQTQEGECFETIARIAKFADEQAAKNFKAFLDKVSASNVAQRPGQPAR